MNALYAASFFLSRATYRVIHFYYAKLWMLLVGNIMHKL